MISIWSSIKFRLYHHLLDAAKSNRKSRIFGKIDSLARAYHLAFENYDYNFSTNGEAYLVSSLSKIGALQSVIDVGANIGDYSKLVRSISEKCRIIAFEPVQRTFQELTKNTENINIERLNLALGSFSGKSLISTVPGDSGVSSMVEHLQDSGGRKYEKEEIQVITGADFVLSSKIERISLLKIDTEGYESEVLKGFLSELEKIDVIQFEYGKANLFSRYFLHDYFRDFFDLFFIGKLYPNGVQFHDTYNWELDDHIGPNYVMVNRRREDIKRSVEC